jgi:penicillin-binding protein 1A
MPRMKTSPEDNWAMDAILRELELVLEPGQMNEGGLKIYTTIDGPLQAAAEQAVRERLQAVESQPGYPHKSMSEFGGAVRDGEKSAPYLQAAVLVLENSSGGIRCIVGGRDYEKNRFNRVATSRREAGSIIMPFVYACAFDAGMTGDQIVSDDRIEPGEIPKDFGNCDPLNLDNSYRGPQPASEGLIESRNIMTVRVGMLAGMDRIANMVVKAGITDEPPRLPLTCLGLFDSTLKDLTAAYTIFPNKGEKVFPHVIDRVLDNQGNILYQNRHNQLPVTSAEAAQKTGLLLNEALSRAASDRTKEFVQFAGKIGLSSDFCDSWCIGYNTDITCGVWLGFDNKKPMNDKYISRNLAIPLWLSIISYTKNKQNNSDKNLKSMPKQEKSPINKSSKH